MTGPFKAAPSAVSLTFRVAAGEMNTQVPPCEKGTAPGTTDNTTVSVLIKLRTRAAHLIHRVSR